eukprot:m.168952 g.168952  ORF g.168952 m.168952 type:complete len:197 (+) comp38969_c0_seq48:530-1120(+)
MHACPRIRGRLVSICGWHLLTCRDFVSLEEVNLCGMGVGNCGQLGEITGMIPNVTALDLSKNLISSWSAVACIVSQLPQLRSLNLSGNSIQSFQSDDECQEFSQVKVLFLNGMQLSWQEVSRLHSTDFNIMQVSGGGHLESVSARGRGPPVLECNHNNSHVRALKPLQRCIRIGLVQKSRVNVKPPSLAEFGTELH